MVDVRQLLAEKLFGVHSVPSRTQVEIQRVYTGLGAEFGQTITDANITFALKREPVAHWIVFAVAHDIFDNWFEVEPLEEGVDKEKFNEAVQKVLLMLNAKDVFTQAAVFERAIPSKDCFNSFVRIPIPLQHSANLPLIHGFPTSKWAFDFIIHISNLDIS